MPRPGFHTITLGCKLNQFDSAAIEGELARRGFVHVRRPESADVVIVNTCTVTHRADADARKSIRRVRRGNPDCRLLVTGCYAEREAETLRRLGGIDRVFGNRDKPNLASILDELGIGAGDGATDRGCDGAPQALHFGERSRAFLKVQEGCRLACSYCIIPEVRGPSRSVVPERILQSAVALFRSGYRELVLTGVNTGDYGRDLAPPTDLATLLGALLAAAGPNRIRLNSLEPLTIGEPIVRLLEDEPRLAPHLQVPLQSGSDTTLGWMRRNYRTARYREILDRLRSAVPAIGLGADVIVGFPGETEALFDESYRFIRDSPLNYLHVFSWSPRPGTPAAELGGRVPEREIRERTTRLRELGAAKSRRFARSFEGHRLEAVPLDRREDGRVRALTGNFIEVLLPETTPDGRAPVSVRIDRVAGDDVFATPSGRPAWADDGRDDGRARKLRTADCAATAPARASSAAETVDGDATT